MYRKHTRKQLKNRGELAFTLVEVCVACALFGIFATTSVYSMTFFNKLATTARYRTLAAVAAQQKIDEIMAASWTTTGTRPAVLTVGTTTENAVPLNNDASNSASGLSTIYTLNDVQLTATRTTTIAAVTGNTRLLQATVTVSFTYLNRSHTMKLVSLRATDNF